MKKIYVLTVIVLTFLSMYLIRTFLKPRDQEGIADSSNIVKLTPTVQIPTDFEEVPLINSNDYPSIKVLNGGTQVFQTFNNCGPSSLSMALSYYGINVSQKELGQELRPFQNQAGDNDDKSVTLSELENKAKEYGFVTYSRPGGNVEIVKGFINMGYPVLVKTWLKEGDDIGHFRVINGYDDITLRLMQDDSLQGKNLWYSYDDFLKLWQGFNYEFLVLIPQEETQQAEVVLGDLIDENIAWQKALKLSQEQLNNNPDDIFAQFNKSVAYYHLKDYQSSIVDFETVEKKLPFRMLWYQIEPILSYYQIGDYDRALSLSNEILSNHNKAFSELYQIQALIYEKQGNQQLASEAFSQAKYYNPTNIWKCNLESIND
jgi:tetratricopeptide (TPR) repeat protein